MVQIYVEPPPRLGLDELASDQMPTLGVIAKKNSKEIYADVRGHLSALIVNQDNRIMYAECVCPSSTTAHALMGCLHDNFPGEVIWKYFRPGCTEWNWVKLLAPESPACMDVKLHVSGWSSNVHHVAMLDQSGALIICQDDATLWRKVRKLTTCPVLEEWGTDLVPHIKESGMLHVCESFGLPDGTIPYVLSDNACELFDDLVGQHVRRIGGLPRRSVA